MYYRIIRKKELKTTRWSGGTTTQLGIWPEDADYATRDFIWRISTASIEAEESEFTALLNVSRKIMVLEGTLTLNHENHHTVELKPFEQDSFMGDWNTTSRGKVTDFNLMVTEGDGMLKKMDLNPMDTLQFNAARPNDTWNFVSQTFYFLSDSIEIIMPDNKTFIMETGDMVIIQSNGSEENTITLSNRSVSNQRIILAVIYHN